MASNSQVPQHKRLAMGEAAGFAKGGMVPGARSIMPATPVGPMKGVPMSPLTKARMNNGIPGYKKSGNSKAGCCK